MKQKVTVSVDGDIWKKFSELRWSRRKSASQMVEDLIKADLGGESDKSHKSEVVEKSVKSVVVNPVERAKVDLRGAWRERHPNDMCPGCKELNKNCKCEC